MHDGDLPDFIKTLYRIAVHDKQLLQHYSYAG
jgi:hypothetical protein